ncbi:transglycosylase SLT domain-containing protein [Candidatus Nomurabacteria bacterium]|nr:transglycosylase SLT domain-containing protein [Candidatus Nomurabacteria bacterium]
MTNLQTYSTSGITGDINDETTRAYLSHQQGRGGFRSIVQAAQSGGQVSSTIQTNMSHNFNRASAQQTIGTRTLTPATFLQYWSLKIAAVKRTGGTGIPPAINSALQTVSQETGVSLATLQTICKIESYGCTNPNAKNPGGYAGLFQLSNKVFQKSSGVWEEYKKPVATNIFDPYHNAYAAARYVKYNLAP